MKARYWGGWRHALSLGGCLLVIAAATAAEPGTKPDSTAGVGLIRFTDPHDVHYAALVLPAPAAPHLAARSHDHVVVVDTSASQNGSYRPRSISVAAEFCRQLPEGDRVLLMAADVSTANLTDDFVATDSPELKAGFDRLQERVPLGSTNLQLALHASLSEFTGDRARSILYIGDGFSTAQLIKTTAMQKLVDELRTAAVPVNSFAIGPRVNLILLGSVAQHTGGVVVIDEPGEVADQAARPGDLVPVARQLAKAAVAPVFYPTTLNAVPAVDTVLPQPLPPVRFDRETVLLTRDSAADSVHVSMTGVVNGEKKELAWNVSNEQVAGSAGFVAQAWAVAEGSQGMVMPWAGRSLLFRSHQLFQSQLETLASAGESSLQNKELDQVDQIIAALQELDPNNRDAVQLQARAYQTQARQVARRRALDQAAENPGEVPAPPGAAQEGPAAREPVDAPPAAPVPADEIDTSDPKSDSLIEELETKRRVREEQLTIDVNLAIEAAKQTARDSYLDAEDLLKRQLDTVIAATEISGDVRIALRKRVRRAIQQLQNENELYEQQRAGLDRRLSQEEAMKKIREQAWRDEEKMQQLIDRVRALMVRGFKGAEQAFEDGEAVSRVAVELDPYSGVPNLDVFNTEAAGALDKARRLRALRADRLLAVLHQVELSHVPFPDEPPILWPSPERWQWITENRRKWKSVDLKAYSKKEEKIVQELEKPTSFDFTDESLDGVRETIMERHGFDIILDKLKLEEESVASDATDITLKVSEISLKNALKLLLDTKNLTYSIENEVMKITTKTEGATKRPLRVYQVGDLTMPINPLRGMGGMGGMRGGMMGGMGGMMGGGGMGMGGMGMGGMGMGGMGMGGMGMGMGGGMFDVPPEKLSPPEATEPAKEQPGVPVDDRTTRIDTYGQAFAQVKDSTDNVPTLNKKALQDRKKKVLTIR